MEGYILVLTSRMLKQINFLDVIAEVSCIRLNFCKIIIDVSVVLHLIPPLGERIDKICKL